MKREVLEHVTEDDYVAALKFSKDAQPIHPCLDTLVQANKKNIDEIKRGLDDVKTNEFVNFTAALVEALNCGAAGPAIIDGTCTLALINGGAEVRSTIK